MLKTLNQKEINNGISNTIIYGNEYILYEEQMIGKGAFGHVFKANDFIIENDDKKCTYAIKEIDIIKPYTKNNFYESSQALEISILYKLRELKSPGCEHIIKYYDFFFIDTDETLIYLVLDLCDVYIFYSDLNFIY